MVDQDTKAGSRFTAAPLSLTAGFTVSFTVSLHDPQGMANVLVLLCFAESLK
jgi:hypothetical protein